MPVPASDSSIRPDSEQIVETQDRNRKLSQFVQLRKEDKKTYKKHENSEEDSIVTSVEIESDKSPSCGTLGVHDFIYSEKHWEKGKIPRVGAA